MKEMMQQHISWWVALAIIALITIGASLAISSRANALKPMISFGGKVTYYERNCTLEPITKRCYDCSLCSNILGPRCGNYEEVEFIPESGSVTNFICPVKGFLYSGGPPSVGRTILGNGFAPDIILQVGVGR